MRRRILRHFGPNEWLQIVGLGVGALIAPGIILIRVGYVWEGWLMVVIGAAMCVSSSAALGHKILSDEEPHVTDPPPELQVIPMLTAYGLKCLKIENSGGSADVRAQIDIVRGREAWLRPGSWHPAMPYAGCWEDNSKIESIRLYQGQTATLLIIGLHQSQDAASTFFVPWFACSDQHGMDHFFGERIESLEDIDQRDALIFQVTIGALPSMAQPFVGRYQLPKSGPLVEVA